MEDFDDAEEMNEEDLLELGDPYGSIDLKTYVQETIHEFITKDKSCSDYINYCIRQLNNDD